MSHRHIMCAIDFGEGSRRALGQAVALARAFEAQLVLAHVIREPRAGRPAYSPDERFARPLRELAAARLADWKRDAEAELGREVEAVLDEGVPWRRVIHLASERGSDLVVVGPARARGRIAALVASVGERVALHASACAVLVAR
jgi:nucleotide-binding universal stress UspA family protein